MTQVGCSRGSPAQPVAISPAAFSGASARDVASALVAVGPRVAGTEGARKAALFLKARLERLGVPAELDEFIDAAPGGSNVFRNVVAHLSGSETQIVLMAHYDTKAGIGERFEGANDSGSGVGVMMELVRVLKATRDAIAAGADTSTRAVMPSFWIVFLDGEECGVHYGPTDGLHGSRHLVKRFEASGLKDKVRAVLLADMIGDRDLSVTIPRNGTPELMTLAFRAASEEGVRSKFSLFPGDILDDHEPFLRGGMPALDLIDFEYGSAPGLNDYWHTESDRMDKVDAQSLQTVGRVIIRMLNVLAHP